MKRVMDPACRHDIQGFCQEKAELDEVGSYQMSELFTSIAQNLFKLA